MSKVSEFWKWYNDYEKRWDRILGKNKQGLSAIEEKEITDAEGE